MVKPIFLLALAALSCGSPRAIRVGSKNFTEQLILGEIVAQHLEARLGVKVERRLNLGGTLLAHQALVAGEIDVYPEYTGTALTAILKLAPAADPTSVFDTVRSEYRKRWKLEWLDSLGFENTFAMVVRSPDARRSNLTTLSGAVTHSGWRLGAGYEFLKRPDGLPGLLKTYPLKLTSVRSMDLGLLYQALEQNQVDMIASSATDGILSARDLTVLADDKNYFPPYQAALVARQAVLEANPALAAALRELSGRFPPERIRKLNFLADGEHRPIAEIAAGALK